ASGHQRVVAREREIVALGDASVGIDVPEAEVLAVRIRAPPQQLRPAVAIDVARASDLPRAAVGVAEIELGRVPAAITEPDGGVATRRPRPDQVQVTVAV